LEGHPALKLLPLEYVIENEDHETACASFLFQYIVQLVKAAASKNDSWYYGKIAKHVVGAPWLNSHYLTVKTSPDQTDSPVFNICLSIAEEWINLKRFAAG
ncbi:MAG: hypothetical protein HKP52_02840, partial [Desulfofustis sp.]|nr:hypothetical protein [Desulfofustis sp.]